MIKKLIMVAGIIIMICVGYSLISEESTPVNDTILECQVNITTDRISVNAPESFWGQECMDCHQNPHDPMRGVPSEKEFEGHKNLDCTVCHSDYDNPQRCVSCHDGHALIYEMASWGE